MTMVEQAYITSGYSHHSNLLGNSNSHEIIPTTTAAALASPVSVYPDLASYGSIPSNPYQLPEQNEALLSPISSGSSPLLQQIQKYPSPSETSYIQQPTPPASSKMYHQHWDQQFNINGQATQTSSPLTTQAPVAHEYLDNNYITDGRRTPGPPVPYMGNYSVSDGSESHPIHPPYYIDMPSNVGHHNTMMMRSSQPMPLSPAPLLHETHRHHIHPQRRVSTDEPFTHGLSEGQRSVNGSPRRRPQQAPGRVKKRPTKVRDGRGRASLTGDAISDHQNCFGREVPPTLKSTCPEEERCIFESRWKHRNQKGHDMWENIQKDFTQRFQKCPGKETLQMKFKRGRAKYIEWNPRDEELLREAWYKVERSRYDAILKAFYELGGSRNMVLSSGDIEIKVVNDLKLEAGLYMESHPDAHIRQRRKCEPTRRRAGARGLDNTEMPLSDEMMSVSSHNTHEDEVINQVYGRPDYETGDEGPNRQNEMMGVHMWGAPQIKIEPDERQDCGNMMAGSSAQPMYGRRRPS